MKELRCRDVGLDCDGEFTAETEDELLAMAGEHAMRDHGMTEEQVSDPYFVEQVRMQIKTKE